MQLQGREDRLRFDDVRAHVAIDPTTTYLNSGSFGPPSRRAAARVAALRSELAQDPMDFQLRRVPPLLWNARTKLAEFVGSDPRRLLFTTNVTEAVNLIATSIKLAAPGEILLSDQEYAPMYWCWEREAQRRGLELRTFRFPTHANAPEDVLDAIAQAITPRTRLMFISHIISATGTIVPIREVCELAHRHGIVTVIDGAHGPAFTSLQLGALKCDYYVGSGHKWLLAPSGTGFLYFGTSGVESVEPLHVSWAYQLPNDGALADEPDRFGSTPRLRRLECTGTKDLCPWLAVPDAIDFLAGYGYPAMWQRMRELSSYTRRSLTERLGLVAITPENPAMSGAMTTFVLPTGTDSTTLQRQLWEQFRVEVGTVEQGARAMLRVSTHFFNTEAEIDQLADALADLLGR